MARWSVTWRGRDGATWTVDGESEEQVRADARLLGWEGHAGSFRRYLWRDIKAALLSALRIAQPSP